jgi:hypothetical protein
MEELAVVLGRGAYPAAWAGFVVLGDGGAVAREARRS